MKRLLFAGGLATAGLALLCEIGCVVCALLGIWSTNTHDSDHWSSTAALLFMVGVGLGGAAAFLFLGANEYDRP